MTDTDMRHDLGSVFNPHTSLTANNGCHPTNARPFRPSRTNAREQRRLLVASRLRRGNAPDHDAKYRLRHDIRDGVADLLQRGRRRA